MKEKWKVFLYPSLLTREVGNAYIAHVSTVGNTLHNSDIVNRIVSGRSELRPETILSILNQRDEIVRDALLKGSSVQDGNVRISPRVTGVWVGVDTLFDPRQHRLTCNMTLTADMRQAISQVGIEVLGTARAAAYIGLVTNASTDTTDGIIAAGDDIIIEGERLRIAPDIDDELGVFFVDENGDETRVTRRLAENSPKKLIARVPELDAGVYSLVVKTRFTSAPTLLKEVRTITYNQLLTVL